MSRNNYQKLIVCVQFIINQWGITTYHSSFQFRSDETIISLLSVIKQFETRFSNPS